MKGEASRGLLIAPVFVILLSGGAISGASLVATDVPTAEGTVVTQGTHWSLRAPLQSLDVVAPSRFVEPNGLPGAVFSLSLKPLAPDASATLEERTRGAIDANGPMRGQLYDRASVMTERANPIHALSPEMQIAVVCRDDCLVFVAPTDAGATLSHHRDVDAEARLEAPTVDLSPLRVIGDPFYYWSPEAPAAVWPGDSGSVSFEGTFEIVAWGADVTIVTPEGTEHYRTGFAKREGQIVPSTPTQSIEESETRMIIIRGSGVTGRFVENPAEGMVLTAADPVHLVQGSLHFSAAEGTIAYDETSRAVSGRAVKLTGEFTVTPKCGEPQLVNVDGRPVRSACTYDVQGDVSRVAVAGHPVFARPGLVETGIAAVGLAILTFLMGGLPGLKAAASVFYTRLRNDEVLSHPLRDRMYALIKGQRAIHLNEISRILGVPLGGITHHLKVLERAGYVRSRSAGGMRFYWATVQNVDEGELTRLAALASDRASAYARRVLASPGVSQVEIASGEGAYRANANYHLRKLEAAGLVRSERAGAGRGVHYYPTPALEAEFPGGPPPPGAS